ncbi:hypothetical protein HMPREF9554_00924 [Treponema phagedenis F0421]|nr:hypothetical protein HMPREF9554_00924 [Treponema phagedenis F0421]
MATCNKSSASCAASLNRVTPFDTAIGFLTNCDIKNDFIKELFLLCVY